MATARTTAPRTTAPRFSGLTIPAAQALNNAAARDRQIAAAADRALVPLTYGEDRIGALIANVLPAGANSTTLLIQCLWGYALDSINDVLLNDLALPAGSTVTHYTGSQSTADAALVAAFAAQGITYTSTLAGYAYSVVAMPTRAFDGQLNITARLRGRRLYDVRKDSTAGGTGAHRLADPATWEWSDCPALADADFLASTTYGIGVAVDWSTVAAAANANDALVGTPAEKRRTLGVSFTAAATALDVAETLRAYASCWHVPGASGIKLLADADGSPLATYAHASGQIAAIQPLVLQDLGNSPTAVEVIFTDASVTPWRESSAVASVSGAGSTLPWRLSLVRMPGVRRYSQAMREATERLNKLRLGNVSTQVDLFDDGIRHDVGDIIAITHPVGLSAQPMRVQQCTMTGLGRWRLDVTEHDAGAYSADVATRTAAALPSFVSPAGPPGAVTGFAVVASLDNGTLLGWADAPESDVNGWELRIGGANWAAATPLGGGSLPTIVGSTSYLWAQPAAGTYTLRIKALDSEGLQSSADTVITPTVAATKLAGIAAGANATSVDANGAIQGVSAGAGTVVSNAQVTINANGTLGGAGSGQVSLTSLPGLLTPSQLELELGKSIALIPPSSAGLAAHDLNLTSLAAAVAQLSLSANVTANALSGAGIFTDPASGTVRISAVEQTAAALNSVAVTVNAHTAAINLRATTSYVDQQIAAAVLTGGTVVFTALDTRLTTAEANISGLTASVALKADSTTVNSQGARLTTAETNISGLTGTVSTKANSSTVTALDTRVTTAETNISALGSQASAVTDLQAGAYRLANNASAADASTLAALLAVWQSTQALNTALALAHEELTAKVNGDVSAEAVARLLLAARVAGAEAAIVTEQLTRATADSATASQVSTLQARLNTGDIATSLAAVSTSASATASAVTGLNAQLALKVQTTRSDGKLVLAGIGLASTSTGTTSQSEIILAADTLTFVPSSNPNAATAPLLTTGTVNGVTKLIITSAVIGDLTVGTLALAEGAATEVYSAVTNSGPVNLSTIT